MSRLARALWIEISMVHIEWNLVSSRGSREPCGLKFEFQCLGLLDCDGRGSREPCGLKFHVENGIKEADNRRGSREPCGLKYFPDIRRASLLCRGSREPCGLKSLSYVID